MGVECAVVSPQPVSQLVSGNSIPVASAKIAAMRLLQQILSLVAILWLAAAPATGSQGSSESTGAGVIRTMAAGAASPWLGAWRLDVSRSVYRPGPGPYRRGTCRIEALGDRVRMVYDLVPVRGGLTHMEWTGRFDGRDYPVQGVDEVITYAYTPLDARTMQVTLKVDGRVAADATVVLSEDGAMLTTDTRVLDARGGNLVTRTVYERQGAGS